MVDLDVTPKNDRTKLRRSYAILDIAAMALDAAESEVPQESNDEYGWPETRGHAVDEDLFNDAETPKKKQKTTKVAVRDAINANRKEQEPRKAEHKVSPNDAALDHPVQV